MATLEFPIRPTFRQPVDDSSSPSQDDVAPVSTELRDVLIWHGVWTACVAAALVALAAGFRGLPWATAAALALGGAPGLGALWLRRADSPRRRALLLALWAGCGVASSLLVGGVSGPLAVWCLAPAAAAAVFGGSSLLAEAAAVSLAAAAIVTLAGLVGLTPAAPPPQIGFWLGFVGLVTTGLGLGAGLLLARRRSVAREAERRAAAVELGRLLDEQPYLILKLDAGGGVIEAFGGAPSGCHGYVAPGRRLVEVAAPADQPGLASALWAAQARGSSEHVFAPAGAPLRSCAAAFRRGSDGSIVAVLRDRTADAAREAELEAAREEAESLNAGKSRFLANMSHELRTPLNAVMGFSDVMRSRLFGDLQPRYVEYAEMIHDAGQHLLDLINDVLDISKIEASRYELSREEFDAREAVSSALRLTRLHADQAKISLRGLLPPEPLEVDADRRAVKQIVLNLVSNALKFTPPGGSVTVTAHRDGEDLEIVVSDTGAGIAQADLERLGRPYEQAGDSTQRTRGTGLGLSLVRAFAELHGGGMTIESRLGEGTAVTVRMPVMRPAAAQPPPDLGGKVIAFKPGRGMKS